MPQPKPLIRSISCYKVLNSRADWTLRTKVTLTDGSAGVETIPDGASRGENEAVYIPTDKAVHIVNGSIHNLLVSRDPFDQHGIDQAMVDLDGTPFKSNLGGNSTISVSLAIAKACAVSLRLPLYKYLADLFGEKRLNERNPAMPVPLFNILNGGKHAQNNLAFQEFMVIPTKGTPIEKSCELGVTVYHELKRSLIDAGYEADVGDEGGFAPERFTAEKALQFIRNAAAKHFSVGRDVFFGMDAAAGSFYNKGKYVIKEERLELSALDLVGYYGKILSGYELVYLEDPFYEKDITGWLQFFKTYSKRVMITGDDLVVTNPAILADIADKNVINAVIVKPNQVGTLTETLAFIKMAQSHKMEVVISHRSGDTAEDTFIADLAVAVGADFIKSGAPARGERVAKYNRLLEISHELAGK